MKTKFMAFALILAGFLAVSPAISHAQGTPANPFEIPAIVNGQPAVFTITDFVLQNGQLVAQGTVTGVSQVISAPAQIVSSTCQILTLNIGAIHLDLLGLVVDVAAIDIGIAAEAAPGNLLGNLLCAVTNLLNNPSGALNGVVALLNRILSIFG